MLNIILITPFYSESQTPAGLRTAALADAFTNHGYRVHVICSMTIDPRPRHECTNRLTIHRLETRRNAHPLAFAIQAARRTHELARSNACEAIECIDAPECLLALATLRETGALSAPLVALSTQHAQSPLADTLCPTMHANGIQWEDTKSIVNTHEQLWAQQPNQLPTAARLALWQSLENESAPIRQMETIQ